MGVNIRNPELVAKVEKLSELCGLNFNLVKVLAGEESYDLFYAHGAEIDASVLFLGRPPKEAGTLVDAMIRFERGRQEIVAKTQRRGRK